MLPASKQILPERGGGPYHAADFGSVTVKVLLGFAIDPLMPLVSSGPGGVLARPRRSRLLPREERTPGHSPYISVITRLWAAGFVLVQETDPIPETDLAQGRESDRRRPPRGDGHTDISG